MEHGNRLRGRMMEASQNLRGCKEMSCEETGEHVEELRRNMFELSKTVLAQERSVASLKAADFGASAEEDEGGILTLLLDYLRREVLTLGSNFSILFDLPQNELELRGIGEAERWERIYHEWELHLLRLSKADFSEICSAKKSFAAQTEGTTKCSFPKENNVESATSQTSERDMTQSFLLTIANLLHVRDSLLCKYIDGMLYQAVLFNLDLGSRRDYCHGGLKQMWNHVLQVRNSDNLLPAKLLYPNLAKKSTGFANDDFVLFSNRKDSSKNREELRKGCHHRISDSLSGNLQSERRDAKTELFPPAALLTELSGEFRNLQAHGRKFYYALKQNISSQSPNQTSHTEEELIQQTDLRDEYTQLFRKHETLEAELKTLKATKHSHASDLIENLQKTLYTEKHKATKLLWEKNKLTTKLEHCEDEKAVLKKKNDNLSSQNQLIASHTNPKKVEILEENLTKTKEAVEITRSDLELLRNLYRKQFQETNILRKSLNNTEEMLKNANNLLRTEKNKNEFLEKELEKKTSLIIKIVAARESIRGYYLDAKQKTEKIEKNQKINKDILQNNQMIINAKNHQIQDLTEQLSRSVRRIDYLEEKLKPHIKS